MKFQDRKASRTNFKQTVFVEVQIDVQAEMPYSVCIFIAEHEFGYQACLLKSSSEAREKKYHSCKNSSS